MSCPHGPHLALPHTHEGAHPLMHSMSVLGTAREKRGRGPAGTGWTSPRTEALRAERQSTLCTLCGGPDGLWLCPFLGSAQQAQALGILHRACQLAQCWRWGLEDAGTGHHGAAQDGSLSRAGVPTLPVIPQGLWPVPALSWLCFLLWRFEFSSLLCLPEGLWGGWHEMEGAEDWPGRQGCADLERVRPCRTPLPAE